MWTPSVLFAPVPSYLDVAVLAGQMKGRGALVGACVDVGSVADQQSGQRGAAVQGGDMERRETVNIAAVNAQSSGLQDRKLRHTRTTRIRRMSGKHVISQFVRVRPSEWERSVDTDTAGGRAEP